MTISRVKFPWPPFFRILSFSTRFSTPRVWDHPTTYLTGNVTPDRLLRNSKLLHPTNCVTGVGGALVLQNAVSVTPLLRCDPRMGATTVSSMDGHIWRWAGKYTVGIRTRVRAAVGPLFEMLHIYMVWLGFAKTHTYPVWGMTTLRQFRSSGPMRAPCSRGLSLGHFIRPSSGNSACASR